MFLFCFVCCWFYCALNTQQGGYVRITSLIIIIIKLFKHEKWIDATLLKTLLCDFNLFLKNMTTNKAETFTCKLYYIHLNSLWVGIHVMAKNVIKNLYQHDYVCFLRSSGIAIKHNEKQGSLHRRLSLKAVDTIVITQNNYLSLGNE